MLRRFGFICCYAPTFRKLLICSDISETICAVSAVLQIGSVVGLIPAGVSGFFIDINCFRSHYGPGVDSTSNRNEYQEYFLGVKTAGA